MKVFLLVFVFLAITCNTQKTRKMTWEPLLKSVNNKTIQFASYSPERSAFAVLERNIIVTGPDSVLQLLQAGDTAILPSVIDLLKESTKAWAAEIILTALTAGDAKVIESFNDDPQKWWETVGANSYAYWNSWYIKNKDSIEWNSDTGKFDLK